MCLFGWQQKVQPIKMQAVDRPSFIRRYQLAYFAQSMQTLLLCAAACTCVLHVYITLISKASIPRTFLHKTYCVSGPQSASGAWRCCRCVVTLNKDRYR